jgi:hypothetical protein
MKLLKADKPRLFQKHYFKIFICANLRTTAMDGGSTNHAGAIICESADKTFFNPE